MTYSAIGAIAAKNNSRHLGVALLATARRPGRFDLPGTPTGTVGVARAGGRLRPGFLVAAAIAALTLVVAITAIRLRRADLAGHWHRRRRVPTNRGRHPAFAAERVSVAARHEASRHV